MAHKGLKIMSVQPGSIAEDVGIQAGDRLLSMNGKVTKDLLDYQFNVGEALLLLELSKENGEVWEIDIEKELDEALGIEPEEMKIRQCPNKCLFCFVDQMPSGEREGLYIRDEDYRFSFFFGNYITLTNLTRRDKLRIFEQKMSPLYISVHTTDPALRRQLLENPRARNILGEISEMLEHKIVLHTQIVLCPDLNDGHYLSKSVEELADFFPGVASLSIVPVGLTRHREGLPVVKTVDADYARRLIRLVDAWQMQFKGEIGDPFVFAADEWYAIGKVPFPPLEAYGDLQQVENGVGMVPLFLDRFERQDITEMVRPKVPLRFFIVTGTSFTPYLAACLKKLQCEKIELVVVTVLNHFFGDSVTVAGLITGGDIVKAVQKKKNILSSSTLPQILLIPSVTLNESKKFLDGETPQGVEEALNIPTHIVPSDANGLIEALKTLSGKAHKLESYKDLIGEPIQIV